MERERWQRVDELFEAALELEGDARTAFLDEACAGDPELRREVEKLLHIDEQAGEFIEKPPYTMAADLLKANAPTTYARSLEGEKPGGAEVPSTPSSEPIDESRFAPGTVLVDRYRIVSLLGRGGMGEVYRADDLKLRQPVALKFLPAKLSHDGATLARFFQEVSVARQISHRNVCRVYDVGEADGQHFISMEFVRGEELASLLKRIGRLPQDKAVEFAREVCLGLAAIHERGVLHRDLKPANVMIDDAGNARITDFGLAALAEGIRGREATSGTPAYMSPEQLAGDELTFASDVYSLGLVLYELFTGRRAFEAESLGKLLRLRASHSTPTSPSEIVTNFDPVVERTIMRCLDPNPKRRPAAAVEVAAALPGGNPLEAAMAAGETPSPEMVAAAPKEGALRPAVAIALFVGFLLAFTTICFLSAELMLHRQVPLEKPPEVLEERARTLLDAIGGTSGQVDRVRTFGISDGYGAYVEHVKRTDASTARWDGLARAEPPAILFHYWQKSGYFEAWEPSAPFASGPPRDTPGVESVTLDTRGRLLSFYTVPTEAATPARAAEGTGWEVLFEAAGLDLSRFTPVEPVSMPPYTADERVAWEGVYPESPDVWVHVEAAAFQGVPVYFEIFHPWDLPAAQAGDPSSPLRTLFVGLLIGLFLLALVGGALLAVRNLRLGRGDRRGAFRLALLAFVGSLVAWALVAHHVPTSAEYFMFIDALSAALFQAAFFWVLYIALEPIIRRRWPEQMISWSRALSGRLRDPLVGRDVLIGMLFGAGIIFSSFSLKHLYPWFGLPPSPPVVEPASALLGFGNFFWSFPLQISAAFQLPFIGLFVLVVLSILLRRRLWAAVVSWVLMATLIWLVGGNHTALNLVVTGISATLSITVLYRFGLLASIAAMFVLHTLVFFPITTELTAWYATGFALDLLILIALALYAFHTSLGGQPLVPRALLED